MINRRSAAPPAETLLSLSHCANDKPTKVRDATNCGENSRGKSQILRQIVVILVVATASFFAGYLHCSSRLSAAIVPIKDVGDSFNRLDNRQQVHVRVEDTVFGQALHGWKAINVFYGEQADIIPFKPQWHGDGQSKIVYEILKGSRHGNAEEGYFVDLAANEAVFNSNTLSLERDHGWNGLCIEPVSAYWNQLAHRNCTVIGTVVGKDNNAVVEFEELVTSGHQGIVGDGFRNAPTPRAEKSKFDLSHLNRRRRTVTLAEILRSFASPRTIDYLSLDIEGAEEYVMETFPYEEFTFLVISVENPTDGLKKLFASKGYQYSQKVGADEIWIHASLKDSKDLKE